MFSAASLAGNEVTQWDQGEEWTFSLGHKKGLSMNQPVYITLDTLLSLFIYCIYLMLFQGQLEWLSEWSSQFQVTNLQFSLKERKSTAPPILGGIMFGFF